MRPDDPTGDWGTDGGAPPPEPNPLCVRVDRIEDNDDMVAVGRDRRPVYNCPQ